MKRLFFSLSIFASVCLCLLPPSPSVVAGAEASDVKAALEKKALPEN